MTEVDYLKLCEQYVSFLIASAGVSITVLTLVLTFGFKSETQDKLARNKRARNKLARNKPAKEVDLRSFLVAALIVSTVYCFVGAQMMTETAGFFSHLKEPYPKENPPEPTLGNLAPPREKTPEEKSLEEKLEKLREQEGIAFGKRLFLLASTNIFITVILLLFALMLLPTASEKVEPTSIGWISVPIFWVVVACAFGWMWLAIKYRKYAEEDSLDSLIEISILVMMFGGILSYCMKPIKVLLLWTFILIGCFPAALLSRFAWIFSDLSKPKADNTDVVWLFIVPITFSYVSLGIAGMRMMFPEKLVYDWLARWITRPKLFRDWIVHRKARLKSSRRKNKSGS